MFKAGCYRTNSNYHAAKAESSMRLSRRTSSRTNTLKSTNSRSTHFLGGHSANSSNQNSISDLTIGMPEFSLSLLLTFLLAFLGIAFATNDESIRAMLADALWYSLNAFGLGIGLYIFHIAYHRRAHVAGCWMAAIAFLICAHVMAYPVGHLAGRSSAEMSEFGIASREWQENALSATDKLSALTAKREILSRQVYECVRQRDGMLITIDLVELRSAKQVNPQSGPRERLENLCDQEVLIYKKARAAEVSAGASVDKLAAQMPMDLPSAR